MDDRPSMGRSRGRGRGQEQRGQPVAAPPAGSGTPIASQVSGQYFQYIFCEIPVQ